MSYGAYFLPKKEGEHAAMSTNKKGQGMAQWADLQKMVILVPFWNLGNGVFEVGLSGKGDKVSGYKMESKVGNLYE